MPIFSRIQIAGALLVLGSLNAASAMPTAPLHERQTVASPGCPAGSYTASTKLWMSYGMDDWLTSLVEANADVLLGDDSADGFTEDLMGILGWSPYNCDNSVAGGDSDCSPTPPVGLDPCVLWLHKQISQYELFLSEQVKALDAFQAYMPYQVGVFQSFYPPAGKSSPSSAGFDTEAFAFTAAEVVLGTVPVVGGLLSGFTDLIAGIFEDTPKYSGSVSTPPSAGATFTQFVNNVSENLLTWATQIYDVSVQQGRNGTILDMLKGGSFFVENDQDLTINSANLWENYTPLFDAQMGLAAMKSQGVFLLRAQWNVFSTASSCTQTVADIFAGYINPTNSGNIAWCDADGVHVYVPISGWNMDVYRYLDVVQKAPFNTNYQAVGQSAQECFPNFGPSNPHITPFQPLNGYGIDFRTETPDLSVNCTWSLPVAHFADWNAKAVSDSEVAGMPYGADGGPDIMSIQEEIFNTASWFSWEMGFWAGDSPKWCYTYLGKYYCDNYYITGDWPVKVINPTNHLGTNNPAPVFPAVG